MRLLLAILGIVFVFIAPPWLTAMCILALSLRWRAWEVLLIGACADILWFPGTFSYGIPVVTLFSLVVLIILEPLRNELLVDRRMI